MWMEKNFFYLFLHLHTIIQQQLTENRMCHRRRDKQNARTVYWYNVLVERSITLHDCTHIFALRNVDEHCLL